MAWYELSEGADGLARRGAHLDRPELEEAIRAAVDKLEGLENRRMYGGDVADSMKKSYEKSTESGPFNQAVNDQVRDLTRHGEGTGQAVVKAAVTYKAQDESSAHSISSAVREIPT